MSSRQRDEIAPVLSNPLLSLPPPYSDLWTVSVGSPITATTSGQLILGGGDPVAAKTVFQLQPRSQGRKLRLWDDLVTTCWSIDGGPHVFETLFDSGSISASIESDAVKAPGVSWQQAADNAK